MRSINHYKAGVFSRRYQVDLPTTDEQPIMQDERNIDEYYVALKTAFKLQEIAELTGIDRTTLWRNSD
jgi:transcriptional regulator of acetoin/glycerol metabolism